MNILLINHYVGSLHHGMEFRPFYLAREWEKLGHNVTIIGATYSHLRKMQPDAPHDLFYEQIDGVSYCWLKTPPYQGNGSRRAINIFTFVAKLYKYASYFAKKHKPDLVIASSTFPLDVPPARLIARKSKAKLVYEVHDLWPLSLVELGGMSTSHPFIRLMQWAENYACRHVDKIVSILPTTKEHFISHGMADHKYAHIPNGIDVESWAEPIDDCNLSQMETLRRLKKENKFIVGYFGAHGVANALSTFVKSATLINDNSIVYVLVGQGQEKANLEAEAEQLGLYNVLFLQPIEKTLIPLFLSYMDALYIGWQRKPITRFGVSQNKTFDYMMAGKPVIYAIEASNNIIQDSGGGIAIPAENDKAVAEAVIKLKSLSQNERDAMGEKGKEYVKANHDYRILAQRFLECLA